MAKKTEKDKAWDRFSIFIRTRDCIKYGGSLEDGMCVTCQRPYPFKKLQAGHFIGGRTNSILLDEDLVHAQCYGCNVGRGGAYVEYFVWMEEQYGREMIDVFRGRKAVTLKMTDVDWLHEQVYWKKRTQMLIDEFTKDKYSPRMSKLLELGKTIKDPAI